LALAYRIDSYQADLVRKWAAKRITRNNAKKESVIIFHTHINAKKINQKPFIKLLNKDMFQEKNVKPKPPVLPKIFLFVPKSVFSAKGLPLFFLSTLRNV
jgi:hypothetical protein